MSLTTKPTIKTLLGVSDTSLDAVIDVLIPQADAIIKGYLGREIEQATYTEYYSGSGDQVIVLNQTPVQSITSVNEDRDGFYGDGTDAFPASSLLVQGADYVLRKDDATNTEVSKSGILYPRSTGKRPWIRSGEYQGGVCSWLGNGTGRHHIRRE